MFMEERELYDERLLKLAAFLRTLPKSLFDMRKWVREDKNGHRHKHASLECKTTACAGGWATYLFKENGLTYDWRSNNIIIPGKTAWTHETMQKFFGIDDSYTLFMLFGASHERTPKEEAEIIEQFVEERKGNGRDRILLGGRN
jgi:hypothetical protein